MEPFHPRNLPQEYEILPLCPMSNGLYRGERQDARPKTCHIACAADKPARRRGVCGTKRRAVVAAVRKASDDQNQEVVPARIIPCPATAPAPLRPPPSPSVQAARPATAVQQRRSSPLRPGEYEMPRMYVDPRPSLRARSPPRPTREEEIADVIFYNFGVKI